MYNCAIPAHYAAEPNMIDSIQRGEIGILYLHAALFAIVGASMWVLPSEVGVVIDIPVFTDAFPGNWHIC